MYASNDSTCLPNTQLRAALKLIEKGRQCEYELELHQQALSIAERRMMTKDSIISIMADRINIAGAIRETYERDVELYQIENRSLSLTIAGLKKDLKKQKRKTTAARIGMVAIAGVAAYIILKP